MDEKRQAILDKWIKMKAFKKLPKIVTPDCLKDKEFVLGILASLKLDFPLLQLVPDKLKKDPEVVIAALNNNPSNLNYMDKSLYNNKDVVLMVVQIRPDNLKYASDKLKGDHEVVLKALEQPYGGSYFRYASPKLRADRELVIKAFESYVWAFADADKKYYDDKEIAMIHPGFALASHFLSPRLCADRELVMAAVKEKPTSYRFASDELKADKEILLTALYHNYMEFYNDDGGHTPPEEDDNPHPYDESIFRKDMGDMFPYTYAPKELKLDKDVAVMAAGRVWFGYAYILPEMRKYPEVFLAAFKINRAAIEIAPKEIKNDVDTMRKVIEIDSSFYRYLPLELKNDKDYMVSLIKKNPNAYSAASYKLKTDKEIIQLVIDLKITALESSSSKIIKKDDKYYISFNFDPERERRAGAIVAAFSGLMGNKDFQKDVRETGERMMQNQEGQLEKVSFDMEIKEQQAIEVAMGTTYYFVDKSLFADKDFAKKIVAVDPFSIVKLANELKNDKEVILAAVSKEGASLKYASDALKRDAEVVKVALDNWNNTLINPKGVIPADILEKIKN